MYGEAPVTRALARAGLALLAIEGIQRSVVGRKLSTEDSLEDHEAELHAALTEFNEDLTVAEFLRRRFAGSEYDRLRRSVERMVEGYDAADRSEPLCWRCETNG